jgi:hypothetical protein
MSPAVVALTLHKQFLFYQLHVAPFHNDVNEEKAISGRVPPLESLMTWVLGEPRHEFLCKPNPKIYSRALIILVFQLVLQCLTRKGRGGRLHESCDMPASRSRYHHSFHMCLTGMPNNECDDGNELITRTEPSNNISMATLHNITTEKAKRTMEKGRDALQ